MTPWQLAKTTEHSHQRALFAWANMVANKGFILASDARSYKMSEAVQIPENIKLTEAPVPEMRRLFAIHNQGHGDAVRGGRAKAEGVKPGVPDVMLPVTAPWFEYCGPDQYYYGLFIELKVPKKGTVSGVQTEWHEYLDHAGYCIRVCVGWIEAANVIAEYMGHGMRIRNDYA